MIYTEELTGVTVETRAHSKPESQKDTGGGASDKNGIATPLLILACKLQKSFFSHLLPYPYPLEVTISGKQISISFPSKLLVSKYIPILTVQILLTLVLTWGSCALLLFLQFFSERRHFGVLVTMYWLLLAFCLNLQICTELVTLTYPDGVEALNELLRLERENFTKAKGNKNGLNIYGGFLLGLILIVPGLFPLLLINTFAQLDPFYYILEMVLPSPYYREVWLILLLPILRFLISFIGACECVRAVWLELFCGLVFEGCTRNVLSFITKLPSSSLRNRKQLRLYRQLRIIYEALYDIIGFMSGIGLFALQGMTTLFLWISIAGQGLFPIPFYFLSVYLACVSLSFIVLLMPKFVQNIVDCELFLKRKRTEFFTFNRSSPTYYYTKVWASQQGLQIRIGKKIRMEEDLPIKFLEMLLDNVMNAVMLIQP